MKDLATALSAANAAVFTELGLDPKHADVRRSDRPDLGEFQANGALAVAKAAGKKPQEVAQASPLVGVATDLASAPTIAGPGFLNFKVTPGALASRAQFVADDARLARARSNTSAASSSITAGRTSPRACTLATCVRRSSARA
jgi:arginyl-tRNA synthetase